MIWAPPRLHVIHVPGADPERDKMVADLQRVTDVCLHPDPERRGVMWNWDTAMQCISGEAEQSEWHFTVQDDMVPYRGWMQNLERACRHSPRPLLGLVWIGKQWGIGAEKGAPYMTGPNVLRGGAVAYHQSVFPELAKFSADAALTDYRNDDIATSMWAQEWMGWEPALTSRTIFDSVKVKSLMSHARYDTGCYSIENRTTPEWDTKPASVRVRIAADRPDEGSLLAKMGWKR